MLISCFIFVRLKIYFDQNGKSILSIYKIKFLPLILLRFENYIKLAMYYLTRRVATV